MARTWWQQLAISRASKGRRRRLAIETLESRITPAATPLTYSSSSAFNLTLKLQGTELLLVDSVTNNPLISRALTDVSAVSVTGGAGVDNTLSVDFDNGGYFTVTGGINFDGG